jgi:hypothetical protein
LSEVLQLVLEFGKRFISLRKADYRTSDKESFT